MESDYTAKDFIEDNYFIKDKRGQLVNFKFNYAQKVFYNQIKGDYGKKPSRYIILKARQLGMSTFSEAMITFLSTNTPNTDAVILAHTAESSNKIYEMTQLFISNLSPNLRPKQKYSSQKKMVFDSENGGLKSSIRVMVANDSTRGGTYKLAHLSEVAFWDHPEDALLALNQAVPMNEETLIIIESTANGFNYFYSLWQDAVNGRNDYTPLFFPWYVDPSYSIPFKGGEKSQYEVDIQEKFSLTDDQIQWRRWCIANNCGGDELKFRQEYPITPEEAFITSGKSVFNTEIILEHMRHLLEPIKVGYFRYDYDGMSIRNIHWVEDKNGYIKIYKEPDGQHVIGGDTAGEGSDYFVDQVLNRDGFLCATLHNQFDTDLYTKQTYCLGRYYNDATIAIESNFDTFPNMELQRLRYPNLFVRKRYDQIVSDVQEKFGFRTTSATRNIILDQLIEVAREDIDLIHDRETLQEMLSFVVLNGKKQASEGAHDDLVMALAIAHEARCQLPRVKKKQKHEKLEKDKDEDDKFFEYGM